MLTEEASVRVSVPTNGPNVEQTAAAQAAAQATFVPPNGSTLLHTTHLNNGTIITVAIPTTAPVVADNTAPAATVTPDGAGTQNSTGGPNDEDSAFYDSYVPDAEAPNTANNETEIVPSTTTAAVTGNPDTANAQGEALITTHTLENITTDIVPLLDPRLFLAMFYGIGVNEDEIETLVDVDEDEDDVMLDTTRPSNTGPDGTGHGGPSSQVAVSPRTPNGASSAAPGTIIVIHAD